MNFQYWFYLIFNIYHLINNIRFSSNFWRRCESFLIIFIYLSTKLNFDSSFLLFIAQWNLLNIIYSTGVTEPTFKTFLLDRLWSCRLFIYFIWIILTIFLAFYCPHFSLRPTVSQRGWHTDKFFIIS